MSLVVHAPNVHEGGGRTLLFALLGVASRTHCRAIVDTRLQPHDSIPLSLVELRVHPSLVGRLAAEWRLRWLAQTSDTVLCFGNLPPLFNIQGRVILFLQNRYLFGQSSTNAFPLRARLRIALEKIWLRWRLKTVSMIVVQTPTMQRDVESFLGRCARVLPFMPNARNYCRSFVAGPISRSGVFDFLYVASAEPHKNHSKLIEAWVLLAKDGLYPSLCLTLDRSTAASLLANIFQVKVQHRLKVEVVGKLSAEAVSALYDQSKALIYPSIAESLGLPLIEARCRGLPILAAERDYVRDVVDPEQTFDPDSPMSIARAVKRHLDVAEQMLPLISTESFLCELGIDIN